MRPTRSLRAGLLWVFACAVAAIAPAASAEPYTELDRFPARLPLSLTYEPGTCALWVAGRSHIALRFTAGGRHVETRVAGLNPLVFTGSIEGALFGFEDAGAGQEIHRDKIVKLFHPARRDYLKAPLTGGVVLPDGIVLMSVDGAPHMEWLTTKHRLIKVAQMGVPGSFRDIAYDRATDELLAIWRAGGQDSVVIFDLDFRIHWRVSLGQWGASAEGITVQPETGDIFVSYLRKGQVTGEIVRLARTDDREGEKRPAYSCTTS